jgi:type IV pilus assembly protein PilQ
MLFLSGFGYAASSITSIRQLESGESPRFDIKIDQPTTYEAYQMPQVLRYVIDLHHVEPGMVSNLTKLDTPSVKRVLLQQKNLNGLQMTRVIFDLSREMVGRVVSDDGGRRLLVAFTPPTSVSPLLAPPTPAAYSATPMPSPTATVVNQLPPLQKKPLLPVVPDKGLVPLNMTPDLAKELEVVRLPTSSPLLLGSLPAVTPLTPIVTTPPVVVTPPTTAVKPPSTATTVPKPVAVPPVTVPVVAPPVVRPAQQTPLQIMAVKIENDGVLIEFAGKLGNYTTAVYRKPGKLVIDLPPGESRIDKSVSINRFGIRSLRIGQSSERLRVVLDATGETVPVYDLQRSVTGLKVRFQTAVPKPQAITVRQLPLPAKPAAVGTVPTLGAERREQPVIQAIKVAEDGILIEISGIFDPYLPSTQRKPGKLIIDLPAGTTRIDKPVIVNRFGISMVRVGMAPEKLRLVFDATSDVVTAHEIHRVSNGLKVVFPNRK